jgi:hypothetical protein
MRRQEDNIKMDRQEILFDEVDWNQLIQNRTQWRNSVQTEINNNNLSLLLLLLFTATV